MNKAEWKRVARIQDLKEGIPISVTVDETDIFLVRLGEKIYALRVTSACAITVVSLLEMLQMMVTSQRSM